MNELAIRLFLAYISYQHGISYETARKNYGHDELGEYWYALAERVSREMADAMDRKLRALHDEPPIQ